MAFGTRPKTDAKARVASLFSQQNRGIEVVSSRMVMVRLNLTNLHRQKAGQLWLCMGKRYWGWKRVVALGMKRKQILKILPRCS